MAKSTAARFRKSRGFTLLEVLIALAILAIGLAAAMRAIGVATNSSFELKQRMLAQWVAQNRAAELRALGLWPDPGVSEGEAEQAGQRFTWQQKVTTTPNALFRRVEINVARPDQLSHSLASLITYVHRPYP